MRCIRLAAVAAVAATGLATPQTLDCPLRQIAVDYAQLLQPWRPLAAFQQVADGEEGVQVPSFVFPAI